MVKKLLQIKRLKTVKSKQFVVFSQMNKNKSLISQMKVSVLMPFYNAAPYLAAAINSILQQSFTDFELLLIDDGSTDQSLEIAQSFAAQHKDIKILQNKANQGLVYTRNKGLAAAKGEYIACLDADDVALPQRLAKQVAFLEKNPNIALLGSFAGYIDQHDKQFHVETPKTAANRVGIWLLFQNCFIQSSVIFRKSCLENLQYRHLYPPSEDYDLWVQIAYRFPVANLPEVLTLHRKHDTNISKIQAEQQIENSEKILLYQIEKLNLQPSKTEFEIHKILVHYKYEPNLEIFEQISLWLTKLCVANKASKVYKQADFEAVIAEIWHKTCSLHLKFGQKGLKIYQQSALTRLLPLQLKLRLYAGFWRR
jgi:glycosyltransferase involved in cell wall biosynthesis